MNLNSLQNTSKYSLHTHGNRYHSDSSICCNKLIILLHIMQKVQISQSDEAAYNQKVCRRPIYELYLLLGIYSHMQSETTVHCKTVTIAFALLRSDL